MMNSDNSKDSHPVKQYPHQYSKEDQDEPPKVVFHSPEVDRYVLPSPEPAQAHIDNEKQNFQYGTPLPSHIKRLLDIGEFHDAATRGYYFTMQSLVSFVASSHPRNSFEIVAKTRNSQSDFLNRLTPPQKDSDNGAIYRVKTGWTVTSPNECVLLALPAPIKSDGRYEILPQVIDPIVGPAEITCDLHIREPGPAIRQGDPLFQIIPIQVEGTNLDATVEDPQ